MLATPAMAFVLTNNGSVDLMLIAHSLEGTTWKTEPNLPANIPPSSADGGDGTNASESPYSGSFTYSPDGGATLLKFDFSLEGPERINIVPSKSGPSAGNWELAAQPILEDGSWIVRFYFR